MKITNPEKYQFNTGDIILVFSMLLLIAAGLKLKRSHLLSLMERGIKSIMIQVEGTEIVKSESILSIAIKNELINKVKESKEKIPNILKKTADEHAKTIVDRIKKGKKIIRDFVRKSGSKVVISKVIDDIMTEPWNVVNLEKMNHMNSDVYDHVINVTIIALCIGHKFRLPLDEMKQLGLGALNYDIGLLAIPRDIMQKKSPLSEEEKKILHQHPIFGYMMLDDIDSIPPTSSIVALSHHECQDGTGYPKGIKGSNRPPLKDFHQAGLIHRFAEIVATADNYEMLMNGRKHFSPKLNPQEAITQVISMARKKLNFEIIKALISIIAVYPVGTRVIISDSPIPDLQGAYGVVAKVNPGALFQPIILVIENKRKMRFPKPLFLDMKKSKNFKIELAV
jgi:HD-GYP domain-containing protein (c-di-GMP phosphodiesterase class II)